MARRREEWQNHLGWMFEEAAREHATALVRSGVLPRDLVTGRWWATSGTPCEVDVLGLQGTRRVLLGEAKWSSCPLGVSVLGSLRKKADLIPKVVDTPIFALWGRSGVDPAVLSQGALGFSLADILGTETHG